MTWLDNLILIFKNNNIKLFFAVQVKGYSYSQLCKENADNVLVLPNKIKTIKHKRILGLSVYSIANLIRNAYANLRNNDLLNDFVVEKQIDIIITNSYLNIPKSIFNPKTKVLTIIHTVPSVDMTLFRLKTKYIRHLIKTSDKVICVGNIIKKIIDEDNNKVLVLENSCQDMSMKIGKCDELRSHFGIPVDCICIGTMGRVTKDKGILEFIQIFETLAVEYPYLYCVIGGNPITDEDELYMKQIIQEINLSKHKDRIHCLGYVDKLDFYPIIDIFCLVTINTIEAFGLVVIESMSAGIPPIAPKIGGPVDIIDDGVSGFLVTPGSVKEYCEKIRILLEDKEIYRTMSASAIERYKDKYTMAVWEKKWMTLLQEIS